MTASDGLFCDVEEGGELDVPRLFFRKLISKSRHVQ